MEPSASSKTRVGFWLSEKKCKKFYLEEFYEICSKNGLELVKVDLSKSLEEQGPFAAILHKMTDIIAHANSGDEESVELVNRFESYIKANPSVKLADPFDSLRRLLDRYETYSMISRTELSKEGHIFMPPFVDLVSSDTKENALKLAEAGVRYPFICKHVVAHGSRMAHQMAIVFHEGALADCNPPCVAQTFIPHDALLFKIFVIGAKYFIVERPSLKNFYASERETIFFDSHDVSKPDSVSTLSILDEGDKPVTPPAVREEVLDKVIPTLRRILKMSLFGVDIVVEKNTGNYAIIDINAFPGYEGVPDFFLHVTNMMKELVSESGASSASASRSEEDSGVDTGDSSDEKRNQEQILRALKNMKVKRSTFSCS